LALFFYAWGLDLIGPINPNSSKQDIWIITATEYIYSFRSGDVHDLNQAQALLVKWAWRFVTQLESAWARHIRADVSSAGAVLHVH